jgi:hypothetical protein
MLPDTPRALPLKSASVMAVVVMVTGLHLLLL